MTKALLICLLLAGCSGGSSPAITRAQLDGLRCKSNVEMLGKSQGMPEEMVAEQLANMKCPVSRQASYKRDAGPPVRFYCQGTHHEPYFKADQPVWSQGKVEAGEIALPPGFPFAMPPGGKLLELKANAQDGKITALFSYEGDEAAVLATYQALGDPVRRPRSQELHLQGKTPQADELVVGIDQVKHTVLVSYAPAFVAD